MLSRIILLTLLLTAFISCSKEEINEDPIWYSYEPNQEIMIEIEVIPMEDVEVNFDAMIKEVNADYFNRIGVGVVATLKDRDTLSHRQKFENEVFLPYDFTRSINDPFLVYILPKEYIYFEAGGYGILNHNIIILSEDFQVNRTLAHELSHHFGLDHTNEKNNIMRPHFRAEQFDRPNDFNEEQIETIINYLSNL